MLWEEELLSSVSIDVSVLLSSFPSQGVSVSHRKKKMSFFFRALKKALRDTLTRAAWLRPSNF